MNKLISIGFFLLVLVCCSKSTPSITKIYENRGDLLQTFENVGITERNDVIYFKIHPEYCDTLVNNYVFTRNNNSFSFVTCKIEFELTETSRFNYSEKDSIQNYLNRCVKKMREYDIKSVSCDFCHIGITTIFYLNDALVIYIADKSKVTNETWIKYLKKSKNLDKYWYWMSLDDYNNI